MVRLSSVVCHGILLGSAGYALNKIGTWDITSNYGLAWFSSAALASTLEIVRQISDDNSLMDWEDLFFRFNSSCGTPLFVAQMCFKNGARELGIAALVTACIPIFFLFLEDYRQRRDEVGRLILILSACGLGIVSVKSNHNFGMASAFSIFFNYFMGPEVSRQLDIRADEFLVLGLAVSSYLFLRALNG